MSDNISLLSQVILRPPDTNAEHPIFTVDDAGAPNDNFRKNISSEDDLRSKIFGTFVVKFLASLPLLGFSNI